jgi:hypothetical protein
MSTWAKAFKQAYEVGSEGDAACGDFAPKKSVNSLESGGGSDTLLDEEDDEFGSAFGQSKDLAQFMSKMTKKRKDENTADQSIDSQKKQKAEIIEDSSDKPKKKKKHKKDKKRDGREVSE